MSVEWDLHYAAWIIADGEPERGVEEDFDWFSLEFWSNTKLEKTPDSTKSAVVRPDYKYRVVAEVVFLSDEACVIDFGLRAIGYADRLCPNANKGEYVTGEIELGLPLCTAIVPHEIQQSLRRTWRVNGIHADMTPYISRPSDPKAFFRDNSRIQYEPVLSKASVKTHDYVLHCTKLA